MRLRNTAVVAAAVVVAVAGCSRADFNEPAAITDETSSQVALAVNANPVPSIAPRAVSAPAELPRKRKQDKDVRLLAAYACADEQCRFSPFQASSPEEAEWLKTRGFPEAARLEDLEGMGEGVLAEEARKGDLAARAVLGRRQVQAGDNARGLGNLHAASVAGSIFADYQFSLALRDTNLIDSAAYLRRAYLQGDRKAAALLYREFPRLSRGEWLMIDERAMDLYNGLLAQRAGHGRMIFGPRPAGP